VALVDLEGLASLLVHSGGRLGRLIRLVPFRTALLAVRDRQQFADPFVPLGHELGQTAHFGG
jgi:hypothetical protein